MTTTTTTSLAILCEGRFLPAQCKVIVADDIFGGWVSVRGTAYREPNTSNLYCESCAVDDHDYAVEGEIDLVGTKGN